MSSSPNSSLEKAIRASGQGWIIDWYAPKEEALDHIQKTLLAIQDCANQRFGRGRLEISERAIVAGFERNPSRLSAFFQALGGTRTPEMLLMVWRVLHGMEISSISLNYTIKDEFDLCVILMSSHGEPDKPYVSTRIHDFALLRQVGFHEIDGLPVFSGFYPLNLKRD